MIQRSAKYIIIGSKGKAGKGNLKMKRRMLKAGPGEETPPILICQDQLSYTTVHRSTFTLNKYPVRLSLFRTIF